MSSYSKCSGGGSGVGVLTVVQIVFIILKCAGLIDWPWRYVLLPILIAPGFLAVCGIILLIALLIALGFLAVCDIIILIALLIDKVAAYRRKKKRGDAD